MYPRSGLGPRNLRERSQDERYEVEYANNEDSEDIEEERLDKKAVKKKKTRTNCRVSAEGREGSIERMQKEYEYKAWRS